MKQRCLNPKCIGYPRYGALGIDICQEWKESIIPFIEWAYSNGYSDELTLDRKDNQKGYSPENCKWSTLRTQSRNKRNNVWLKAFGEIKCMEDWGSDTRYQANSLQIWKRLKRGWNEEKAVSHPTMKNKYI